MSDSEYIAQVLKGDKRAFRHLVDKYKNMSFTIANTLLRDRTAAEEAVQEAFIKCYRHLGSFEGRARFSTWLYRIVYNESLQHLRARRSDPASLDESIEREADTQGMNQAMQGLREEEQRRFIGLALGRLSPQDSLILRLFYLDEKNLVEIADITGLSGTNIKTILHRARKRLYLALETELHGELRSIL